MAERDYNPQQAQGSSPVSPLLLLTLSLGTLVYLQSPYYIFIASNAPGSRFLVVGVANPSFLLHEHTTTAGSGLRNIKEGLQLSKHAISFIASNAPGSRFHSVVGLATPSYIPHEHTTMAGDSDR